MKSKKQFSLIEIKELTGLEPENIIAIIEKDWIVPVSLETFDDEDVARIHLIQDLRAAFGVNDEAIPIVLHLVDQIHFLRETMRRLARKEE